MKIISLMITMLIMSHSFAASQITPTELIVEKIQQQILDAEVLIEEVGREKISDIYLQKLEEFHAQLLQIKASPQTNDGLLFKVNGLYENLDGILGHGKSLAPQKSIINESYVKGDDTGYIRGFVYDSNGVLVNQGSVRLYSSSGSYAGYSNVDNTGRYIFNNVSAGQYAIVFSPNYNSGLIDTAYPNKACPNGLGYGCQIEDINLVTLQNGSHLENMNIVALNLPTISGQIIDASNDNPLSNVSVSLYDSQGDYIRYVRTDSEGNYTILATQGGEYFLTFSYSDYQLELYNNVICIQECDINLGTAISLGFNQNIENINASLHKSAIISGSMVDADSSLPVIDSSVYILDDSGLVVEQLNMSSTHLWETTVRAGNYYIVGSDDYNDDNYLATKYPANTCLTSQANSCDDINGSLIPHTLTNTTNIVLERFKGARINGTVFDLNNEPLTGVSLTVFYSNNLNNTWNYQNITTDDQGRFSTHQLGNSNYYIVAEINSHLVQLFSNKNCNSLYDCDFGTGTVISINNLNDANGINFQLTPKTSISGKVVDSNNNPLSGLYVRLAEQTSYHNYGAYTNNEGEYEIQNISAGNDYKLYVQGVTIDGRFVYSEVYNNIQCDNDYCNNETYDPIEINTNQDLTIDFELAYKGQIGFDLISNSSNEVESGTIYAVNLQGNIFGSFDANSSWSLPEGDYYFYYRSSIYSNDYLFVSKVFGGTNCISNCDATTGTLVQVRDDTVQNYTMYLDQYFSLEVTSSPNNMYLELYEEDLSYHSGGRIYGTEIFNINNITNKYLKVAGTGYFSQIYDGINCEDSSCDLSQGQLILPVLNSSLAIDFNLSPVSSLSGVITDQNNNPLENKTVRLLSEINSYSSWYTTTNSNGEYSFDAIEPGEYYLKVDSDDGYSSYGEHATTYYGDIACDLSDCSGLGINSLSVNASDYLTGVNIQMSSRGTISGEGIKNALDEIVPVRIYFYRVTGDSFINMEDVYPENGILSPIYLPQGEYKLVARVNNQSLYTSYPSSLCRLDSVQLCAEMSESLFVTNGTNIHFTSFIINQFGKLKVKLMNAIDNTPINNGKVDLYESNGSFVNTFTSVSNNEVSITISSDGLYKLFIHDTNYSGESKHIAQLYNGVDCEGGLGFDCLFSQGQDVSVEMNSILSINANLKPKPRLKVDVLNAITNNQIANSSINIFDAFGYLVWSDYSPNLEESHYVDVLKAGHYYAMIRLSNENTATAYPNVLCYDYNNLDSCGVGLSTFSLQNGDDPKQINIRATPLKAINGYVVDVTTDQPLENVIIDYWNVNGYHVGSEISTTNGGFSKTLSTGEYYISTDTSSDYINEVYNNIQCQDAAILGDCDVTRGELVNVTSNNASPLMIDIELAKDPIFQNGFE